MDDFESLNVQFFCFFLRPATLTLWNRWKDALRKCAKSLSVGNFPASRPSGSAGRHGGGTAGQGRGQDRGSTARRNRRVEPDGVRLSSPMAHRAAHRMADWRRRAGEREREERNGPARSSACFFVCFFSGGASAGRGRRTSGVDGADIGRGIDPCQGILSKKRKYCWRPARHSPPVATPDGAQRRSGVQEPRAKAVPGGPGPRIRSGAARMEGRAGLRCPL